MLNQEKNQAALEKNPIATESAAFSFSVNLDFNNTFSLRISSYPFTSIKFQDFSTGLMFDRAIFVQQWSCIEVFSFLFKLCLTQS